MTDRLQGRLATLAAVILIAVITGRRWWQMGPHPTGLDGGQWLALGRGIFGEGRSTAGAYPPLIPFLTAVTRSFTDPSTALKLIAISSLLAVLVAVYLVARDGLGPWFGLAALATIGPASVLTEPTAFGGYPQQLAFACVLLASWSAAHALGSGQGRWFLTAGGSLLGAALSHHIYFPLALGTCGLVWLLWLASRPPLAVVPRRSLGLLVPVMVSAACFAPTAMAFLGGGYAPPLDTAGLNPWTAFQYGAREAVWPWVIITVAGIGSLALTASTRRRSAAWQVAVALAGGSGALFAMTGEVRLLPPFLTGVVIGLGFGWVWLRERLVAGTRLRALPLLSALTIPALLWLPADREATGYFTYYRTLDASMLGAAAAIDAANPEGTVAVRQDWRNWPIGWWFEGLTTARIAVGSDPRWLGFPEELAHAALVDRFFEQRLEPGQVHAVAADTGVELLAFRKWEWIGWQRWLEGAGPVVEVIYDDNEFLVLRITP